MVMMIVISPAMGKHHRPKQAGALANSDYPTPLSNPDLDPKPLATTNTCGPDGVV